jgi:UDP-glucose 4-epimerase
LIDAGLTGATGHLGGRLLARLLDDPRIARVRTVARGPVPSHPRLVHTRADLCAPEARRALEGVDVLWHLGAQLWRSRDGRQLAVNVEGTANVLAAHPGHVVLASSAAVYGAHPDNPLPLTEDAPPRPNAECAYAWHKLEAERLAVGAAPTAVLRVSAVLGPHADPRVLQAARGYRLVVPATHAPQALQFLDEDDAAGGLLAAGVARARGTWNLAPRDWLGAADIARIAGGRVVRLPLAATIRAAEIAHRLRLLPFGADRACLLAGPLALSPARAAADLGWTAARTSTEVLGDAVAQGAQRYMRQVR